jgi:hypothetical protein
MLVLPLVALLGQVAKVDIRATGTPTSEAILEALLQTTYAGAGLTITGEHMTVHTGTPGSTVIEVTGTSYTNEQVDGYWCMNDPALRNAFKDLAVINTGLSDVTDVITCIGASGEGCASSTPCGGGGGGDPAPAPAPEPEPESGGGGGGGSSNNDDDDDDKLSTTAIVLITIGALVACALLVCIVWPYIESCWTQSAPKSEPILGPVTPTPSGVALPTLFNAV